MNLDFETFVEAYWKYYLTMEHRFLRTEEYVAFDEYNDKTYSIEYLSLLQIVCSEIDVAAKAIARHSNPVFSDNNAGIKKWGYEIQQKFPVLLTQKVLFRGSRILIPWGNWEITSAVNKNGQVYYKYAEGSESPIWWNAYNKVKHARTSKDDNLINFHKANQVNVMTSLAALFSLNRLTMRDLNESGYTDVEKSSIFVMHGWNDEIEENLYFDAEGRAFMHIKQPW